MADFRPKRKKLITMHLLSYSVGKCNMCDVNVMDAQTAHVRSDKNMAIICQACVTEAEQTFAKHFRDKDNVNPLLVEIKT